MSAVVKRALPLLKVLVDATPKLKKAIIKHAPTDLVTAISEIVLNLIKGVIKLTAHQKKRLSRYKKELLSSHIPLEKCANPAPTHACVDPTRHPRSQGCQGKTRQEHEGFP